MVRPFVHRVRDRVHPRSSSDSLSSLMGLNVSEDDLGADDDHGRSPLSAREPVEEP